MLDNRLSIKQLWEEISRNGVGDQEYAEVRRIVLSNQIAFLGAVIPQFYNIFYIYYDINLLLPVILVNIAGTIICLIVLLLNHIHYYTLAKIIICITPNVQIFLLTYYLSTASGNHLLHIMMISFVLFLLSNKSRGTIFIISSIPVVLFVISYYYFTPDTSPIILPYSVLKIFYITISLTVFILVMLFFYLFYRQIIYTENLLEQEHERSEKLLRNILPEQVATRLKTQPGSIAEMSPSVTVLFADIVGFTGIASTIQPVHLISILNEVFSSFDELASNYGLEKIKTIGDAYMVAGGIPVAMENHSEAVANMALAMLESISTFEFNNIPLQARVGFHTGPVIAGVIGRNKFSYDIWGDAVNIASRLESHGQAGKIQVSRVVYEILKDKFTFQKRGEITIKGIGPMETFFLTGKIGN
jgi:adenylate cyclase